MTRCPSCPKADSLETYLEGIISDETDDTITYKKWAQTDGTKLETVQTSRDDFIESLVIAVGNLTTHHYVARNQSAHFVTCKEQLDYETCVLVSDFSENFSFIIQDSIQGYYWANDQATLLPFLGYMKMFDGTDISVSMAVISDHLTHDTLSVHSFLRPVLQFLKTLNPSLKKIKYFTDGSGAQYKNKKNFANLCAHNLDFDGLDAEWHFFASCHGKSACDGIGGTLKRLARLASLQRNVNSQITTPQDLFEWATENVSGIKCFYVNSQSVISNEKSIEKRMNEAMAIKGTRSFHCYVPINSFQIKASSLSGGDSDFKVFNVLPEPNPVFDFDSCKVDDYVACVYETDGRWYLSKISNIDEVNREFHVTFFSPDGHTGFAKGYKITKESSWITNKNMLCKIISLKTTTIRSRLFKLDQTELNVIENKFSSLMADGN